MKALRLVSLFLVGVCDAAFAQEVPYAGRPEFRETNPPAYYAWHDGAQWHVRWASLARHSGNTFRGSVSAEGGSIVSWKKVDSDRELRDLFPRHERMLTVVVAGSRESRSSSNSRQSQINKKGDATITFDSRLEGGVDGFDFKVDLNTTVLTFVLQLNGESKTAFVRLGRSGERPSLVPLVVPLKAAN